MTKKGKKVTKTLSETITVSSTLALRHDIQKAKKLTEQIKEGFADQKAVLNVKVRRSLEERIDKLEETLTSLDERTKTIEKQTRPQTGWQKIKDYIFSSVIGWIIAVILGLILLLLGFHII